MKQIRAGVVPGGIDRSGHSLRCPRCRRTHLLRGMGTRPPRTTRVLAAPRWRAAM